MSAEKPKGNSAFPLITELQKEVTIKEIEKGWYGENGLSLNRETLRQLIKFFGPEAKVSDVIKFLNGIKAG